jgi:hypothetical protein
MREVFLLRAGHDLTYCKVFQPKAAGTIADGDPDTGRISLERPPAFLRG